uniref:DH domain-containing protein n=1 Tax=Macrostomum lignano TaxID=282301 RepID=A0A1I8GDP9_9PLAT
MIAEEHRTQETSVGSLLSNINSDGDGVGVPADPGEVGLADAPPNGAAACFSATEEEDATDATDAAAAAAVEEAVAIAEAAAAAAAEEAEAAAKAAEAAEAASSSDPPNMKRRHAIYEIIDSEESYVNKLRFIAEKYIPLKDDPDVTLPPDLEEKWSIIWGNWWRLLEGHEEILAKLKQAFEIDLDTVANVFIAKERHMTSWYSKYCENHRKAQHIACDQYRDFFEQVRQTLRDKEDMNSHLMNPVQRCMRYSLLVGTVIEKARKDGLQGPGMAGWERMLEIMRELPMKTESIMEASRIDNLETGIRVTSLGQVRIKGVLRLSVINGPYDPSSNPAPSQLKFEQRKIFLFDQMMLVTEVKRSGKVKAGDQFSSMQTIYIYRSKVKMNNMRYFSSYKYSAATSSNPADEEDELLFCVVDTTPGANVVYVFDPVDTTTRTKWVVELRQMEKQQMDFLKILQNPVAGASDHLGVPAETTKKSAKDKDKGRSDSRKNFVTGKSRKSRAETEALPRPQTSRERKNSCPDAEAAAAAAAAAGGTGDDALDRSNKELKKVHSEMASSCNYDQEGGAGGGVGITKKKSGLNFSLQSIFSTKKSKSRSDSKLNPT